MTAPAPTQPIAVPAADAARMIGISPAHFRVMLAGSQVPPGFRLGRRRLWGVEELRAWIAAGAPSADRWAVRQQSRRGYRFAAAFSFPGEKRIYVAAVDTALRRLLPGREVFYDKRYTAELAKPNLDIYLQKIYHKQSELIVVFLCPDYARKEWCGLEWRAIRDLIKKRRSDAIMLFRFDQAEISGLFSIDGYVDANSTAPEEAARLIQKRLLAGRS